jgi:hypothetical protein
VPILIGTGFFVFIILWNSFRYKPGNYSNYSQLKIKNMRGLLYIIAVILVIGWAFGFFYYSAGGIIHVLLVIAIVALLLGVIRRA